jgi:Ni/Fe-hydrogenase 1 B-type cytochrome subunit
MSTRTALAEPAAGTSVYVYEGTVRLWHWLNAFCIFMLIGTGLLIASPLASVGGEASASYLMGYIRFVHFATGYTLAVLFLVRVYWALVGNEHARALFHVPVFDREWRAALLKQVRWYMFLETRSPKHVGHNPLANVFMFVFVVILALMILSGLALYAEGAGAGSWQDRMFGWVIPLFGGSQALHSWHHLGMWGIATFIILHVYAAVREEIMSRQTMLGAIISGTRSFRD